MPYTIQIDNNTVETTLGFTATFRLDEQLDTASFVVPATTKKDPFATNLTVAVNDGFTTSYWLIASDYVEPVSVNPSLYSHTIDLIEYTKKLEYYFISALAFTQPTDGSIRYNLFNVIDRLRKTIDVELDSTTTNFPYDIPTSTELALINFKSPEMFFNNMTLLEALKQTLMYVGALPRLTQQGGQDILLLDFIAEKKDLFP